MYAKRSRDNTKEEKRMMLKNRKKRKKVERKRKFTSVNEKPKATGEIQEPSEATSSHHSTATERLALDQACKYKNMAQSYWERWQWELTQRKYQQQARGGASHLTTPTPIASVLEIDPLQLFNPNGIEDSETLYVGRGSFGVVKHQIYRGFDVAVKELLPRTLVSDVKKEAMLMAQLCHPCLPHLFGICSKELPYRIVMQYHNLNGESMTLENQIKLRKQSTSDKSQSAQELLDDYIKPKSLCHQLFDGLQYLHENAKILHNDIKKSNIMLCKYMTSSQHVQVVLIDFGLACYISEAKTFKLSEIERAEWFRHYSHIAPEVIEGITPQSIQSDIYSVGGIVRQIAEFWNSVMSEHTYKVLSTIAARCRAPTYNRRPHCGEVLQMLEGVE